MSSFLAAPLKHFYVALSPLVIMMTFLQSSLLTPVSLPAGLLPLRGSIPDMTADSERYIALQNVYRDQANRDVAAVTAHVHTLLQTLGQVSQARNLCSD